MVTIGDTLAVLGIVFGVCISSWAMLMGFGSFFPDRADRASVLRCRPGHPRRGDPHVRRPPVDRGRPSDALRHLPRHIRVHGALRSQECRIHSQQGVLERGRVRDDAAANGG